MLTLFYNNNLPTTFYMSYVFFVSLLAATFLSLARSFEYMMNEEKR